MGTLSLKSTGQGQDKLAEFFDTFCPGRRQEKWTAWRASWQWLPVHQFFGVLRVEIAFQHLVDHHVRFVFQNDGGVELAVFGHENNFFEAVAKELLPRVAD